ncbi:MAG: glycosyltransferase family 9 protein [Planctomycetaceae bacterium]|jgi:ADP-heptose:LPS heptosyltransferase|nr:glycosyltransferase family 9 protein [Planctomycetaceae bacterium]
MQEKIRYEGKIPRIRRILIICFADVVNIVQGLPIVPAIRLRFPHVEIAWLVEEANAPLLNRLISLDRLIIVKDRCLHSWGEIGELRRRLRAFAPDVTIDLQGRFRSAFSAWISGSNIRIGFGGNDGREGSRWLNNCLVTPDAEHIVERNMQLLQHFGICGSSISFDLFENEIDRYCAELILSRCGLHGNFAIMCVGADVESRLWREERYAGVAEYLAEQWNLPSFVVWGNGCEQKFAERVLSGVAGGAAIIAPAVTVNEFAAIARRSTLVVGSESVQLHVAAAVGARCLGLLGATDMKRNAPYGEKNCSIQKANGSLRSNRNDRILMDAIDTTSVCDVCDRMLAEILESPQIITNFKKTTNGQKVA